MTDCILDLTQDSVYNIIINKDRNLDLEMEAEVYSGDTFVSVFDFTSYTGATLHVRVKPQDSYSVLKFSTVDGSIVLGAQGVFSLVKTALQLQNIKAGKFYYDMYLDSVTQQKRAFLSGQFIINQNVSV